MTYAEAVAQLRGRSSKRIGCHTWLEVRADGIAVRYHATDVVTMHADGTYTLRSGGWHTVTTKRRLNDYSPARVYQQAFAWYIADGSWECRAEFEEGMRVDACGRVLACA